MSFRGGGRGGSRGADFNRRGMIKSQSGPAATFMPPNVMQHLQPAPPLPPLHTEEEAAIMEELREKAAAEREELGIPQKRLTGLTGLLDLFEKSPPPVRPPALSKEERKEQIRQQRIAAAAAKAEEAAKQWDPKTEDSRKTSDGYKTLFLGRLAYETSAWKLQRELEQFGAVKKLRLVTDPLGASRGYAFVEFENEEDMKKAYKRGDGMRIDGRRVLVDVERGRTVKGWRPKRLGGGLGSTRAAVKKKPTKQEREGWLPPPVGCWTLISSLDLKRNVQVMVPGTNGVGGVASGGGSSGSSSAIPPPSSYGGGSGGGGYASRDRDRSRSRDRGLGSGSAGGSGTANRAYRD